MQPPTISHAASARQGTCRCSLAHPAVQLRCLDLFSRNTLKSRRWWTDRDMQQVQHVSHDCERPACASEFVQCNRHGDVGRALHQWAAGPCTARSVYCIVGDVLREQQMNVVIAQREVRSLVLVLYVQYYGRCSQSRPRDDDACGLA